MILTYKGCISPSIAYSIGVPNSILFVLIAGGFSCFRSNLSPPQKPPTTSQKMPISSQKTPKSYEKPPNQKKADIGVPLAQRVPPPNQNIFPEEASEEGGVEIVLLKKGDQAQLFSQSRGHLITSDGLWDRYEEIFLFPDDDLESIEIVNCDIYFNRKGKPPQPREFSLKRFDRV